MKLYAVEKIFASLISHFLNGPSRLSLAPRLAAGGDCGWYRGCHVAVHCHRFAGSFHRKTRCHLVWLGWRVEYRGGRMVGWLNGYATKVGKDRQT